MTRADLLVEGSCGSTAEEGQQLGGRLLRAVLGDDVRGVDGPPSNVRGPRAPDLEHVAVETRARAAARPQHHHWAGDSVAGLPVGVVVLDVDGRSGPVVLAHALDR